MVSEEPLYGRHDFNSDEYGEWFARHMDRMTAEQLHGKAEIAWELAYRDTQIEQLRQQVREMEAYERGIEHWAETGK